MRRERQGIALLEPCDQCGARRIVRGVGSVDLLQADAREGGVIHLRRARDSALVFEMAHGTRADVAVKGARLALQKGFVVRVAEGAVLRLDAFHRRVARGAVVFEKGMRLREIPRTGRALSCDSREWVVHDGKCRRCNSDDDKCYPKNELSH